MTSRVERSAGSLAGHRRTQAAPDPDALAQAVALLQAERLDDAAVLFDEILAREPGNADALHFCGVLRHAQGDPALGIDLVKRSLAMAPGNASAWNNLGNMLACGQRVEEARQAYGRASLVRDDPAAAHALSNIATLARRAGDHAAAESSCREAIALRPDFGDAWYNLSLALLGQGRIPEALAANSRAVTLWPRGLQGRTQVIRALTLLGEREQAARLYREWLAEEPDNPVVAHMLAACGTDPAAAVPARASDAYVRSVFDAYAESFDSSLEKLHYRVPALIEEAFGSAWSVPRGELDVVDAGCGTGLCGPRLRPWARRLAGCDLSVGMLRRAKLRGAYDVLHKAELTHYLDTQPDAFDVVVSADTLCYFGDLRDALRAARRSLRPGGRLLFTVEALPGTDDAPWRLQPQGRYAHAREYLRASMQAAGFAVPDVTPIVPRSEGGRDVAGWLVAAAAAPT